MEARGKRAAFSEVRWARSVRPRRRQLPQGPSVCDKFAASSDCSRPVNDYVHIEAADLCRPNARFTPERQGYQVLTPFRKLGYSPQTVYKLMIGAHNSCLAYIYQCLFVTHPSDETTSQEQKNLRGCPRRSYNTRKGSEVNLDTVRK